MYVWVYPHNIGTYVFTVVVAFMCHTMEMMVMQLGFTFNYKYYQKWCKCCNQQCMACLSRIAEYKLEQNKMPNSPPKIGKHIRAKSHTKSHTTNEL